MNIYKALLVGALVAVAPMANARDGDTKDPLSYGMVQLTVKVGITTQADILEKFGAPNVTTIDGSGREMWVYDRHATVTYDKSSGFSIGMLVGAGGGNVGGGGGLGFGSSKSRSEQTQRTMTLILKFDANKVVSDFQSRSSSF